MVLFVKYAAIGRGDCNTADHLCLICVINDSNVDMKYTTGYLEMMHALLVTHYKVNLDSCT